MAISFRVSKNDEELIKAYVQTNNENISDYVRRLIFDDMHKEYIRIEEKAFRNSSGKKCLKF